MAADSCGHHRELFEGCLLPCAQIDCADTPGGEFYVMPIMDDWRYGRNVRFGRKRDELGVCSWYAVEIKQIDFEELRAESLRRTLEYIHRE